MTYDPKLDEPLIKNTTAIHLDEVMYAKQNEWPYPGSAIGIKALGDPDDRTVWLKWRWCLRSKFAADKLRAFKMGDAAEKVIIDALRRIPGVEVFTSFTGIAKEPWEIIRVYLYAGHISGAVDGIVKGIVEAPKTPHLLEVKGIWLKTFKYLMKVGSIKAWDIQYFTQIQGYMGELNLTRCIFVAMCIETGELWVERIKFEPKFWRNQKMRAQNILEMIEPPATSFPNREFYKARFLGANQPIYWGDAVPPPSCRNCRFASPDFTEDQSRAKWFCQRHKEHLTIEEQFRACKDHNFIPALIPAKLISTYDEDAVAEYRAGKIKFWNAPADNDSAFGQSVFNSWELEALSRGGKLTMPENIDGFKGTFGATIAGFEPAGASHGKH